MKKLVVLTGAGISAESGINTFRDANGLWEGHDIMEVASPIGWQKNPSLVLDFYNKRRKQLHEVHPNQGHFILAELERDFDVHIITQNVDNLHEKAGSTNVLHLHGELLKARSTNDENYILDWETDLNEQHLDLNGFPMRPHIVWFGEAVPAMDEAIELAENADIFIVVGTSLQVYPAASLMHYTQPEIPIFYIDPKPAPVLELANSLEIIPYIGSEGLKIVQNRLKEFV